MNSFLREWKYDDIDEDAAFLRAWECHSYKYIGCIALVCYIHEIRTEG